MEIEAALDEAKAEIPQLKPVLLIPLIPEDFKPTGEISTDLLNTFIARQRLQGAIEQAEENKEAYIRECQAFFEKWFGKGAPKP